MSMMRKEKQSYRVYIKMKKENKLYTTQNAGTTYGVICVSKCGKRNNLRILDAGIRDSEETAFCHLVEKKPKHSSNNVFLK